MKPRPRAATGREGRRLLLSPIAASLSSLLSVFHPTNLHTPTKHGADARLVPTVPTHENRNPHRHAALARSATGHGGDRRLPLVRLPLLPLLPHTHPPTHPLHPHSGLGIGKSLILFTGVLIVSAIALIKGPLQPSFATTPALRPGPNEKPRVDPQLYTNFTSQLILQGR